MNHSDGLGYTYRYTIHTYLDLDSHGVGWGDPASFRVDGGLVGCALVKEDA